MIAIVVIYASWCVRVLRPLVANNSLGMCSSNTSWTYSWSNSSTVSGSNAFTAIGVSHPPSTMLTTTWSCAAMSTSVSNTSHCTRIKQRIIEALASRVPEVAVSQCCGCMMLKAGHIVFRGHPGNPSMVIEALGYMHSSTCHSKLGTRVFGAP